jgi:lambda family phage tail tape measure protein
MELSELKFVVNTDALKDAAIKIAALGTAVSKLNKPLQDLSNESAKSNKELVKTEQAAAKAAAAQLKLEEAQSKSAETTGKSVSVLERQTVILEYMAQGLSKGQSSYVATAVAAGALDDDIAKLIVTLKTQRSLMGGDPFDKSIGLMQKLKMETKIATEVTDLFNRGLKLSEKQMTDLAREKERLITLYGIEGRSLDGLSAEYDKIVQKSVAINQANDARTNSMKAQIKAQDDAAKASAYMATEMERVNRLTGSHANITTSANNKLIKFEQALKLSGGTAEQQTAKLEGYRRKLLAVQKAGGDRNVDYLSRALGPQITDVFVGLFSGQSPLTVLVQQGGQLRDQFALAGVAGADMGKMLTKSASTMISSVKDVGVAIGQVFVNAVVGSGKAVVDFAMNITGTSQAMEYLRYQLALLEGSNGTAMKAFTMLGSVLTGIVGVAVFAAAGGLIALAVAFGKVIQEENALNRALNLTGASMGMTLDMAYGSAKAMNQFGVNTSDAVKVLTEMAKAGGLGAISLETVATTAKAMKTAFGVSIEETVKQFGKLADKTTDTLTKMAIDLGGIPLSILKQVDAYERAGNSVKAVALATSAYETAAKEAADRTTASFGSLTRLGISLKGIWNDTWDSIMGFGRKDLLDDQLTKAVKDLAFLQTRRGADNYDSTTGKRVLATSILIENLKEEIKVRNDLAASLKKDSEDATAFEKGKAKRDEAANKLKSDANALENYGKNAVQEATKAYLEQFGALDHLNKSQTALNKLYANESFLKLPKVIQEQVIALYQAAGANEELVKSEKESKEALELKNKLLGSASNLGSDYYKTIALINKYAKDGKFGADEVLQLKAALEATTPEARRLAQAQAENAKTMAGIAADRQALSEVASGDFKTSDEKAAVKNLSDYKKRNALADSEFQKQISKATEETTMSEYMMYVSQADAKKAISQEMYDREQLLLSDSYKRNQAYSSAFENLFKGMGDAIIDFALTGKTSFSDLVNSMIIGLIKLEMQMQMSNAFKAAGGSAGITAGIKSMFGFANGGSFGSSGVQAFANGGSFTNSIVDSPTLFKFAKGTGMMGEAGPEAIMPLRRGSDGSLGVVAGGGGSTGNVSVNVVNNSTSQATTNETTDSKGNRRIEVVIGDMTAGEISRSGSASNKSIKSTFGLQPQLIRR